MLGTEFEKNSLVAPVLRLGSLDQASTDLARWRELLGYPRCRYDDLRTLQQLIGSIAETAYNIVAKLLLSIARIPTGKPVVLSWLAAATQMSEGRDTGKRGYRSSPTSTSGNFARNLCGVLLVMCRPFFGKNPVGFIDGRYLHYHYRVDTKTSKPLLQGKISPGSQ